MASINAHKTTDISQPEARYFTTGKPQTPQGKFPQENAQDPAQNPAQNSAQNPAQNPNVDTPKAPVVFSDWASI